MTGKGSASELARRLGEDARRCAANISPRPSLRQPLDRRRCPQHAGRSMHVRLKDNAEGPSRQVGRRGDGRIWRPARRHPRKLRPGRIPRRRRRSAALPRLPRPSPSREPEITTRKPAAASGSPDAARRLFAMSRSRSPARSPNAICRPRHSVRDARARSLRFHPGCYYRDLVTGETLTLPALIAAVTSLDGHITGLQRTSCSSARPGRQRQGARRRSAPLARSSSSATASGSASIPACPSRSWPPAKASRRWPRSAR